MMKLYLVLDSTQTSKSKKKKFKKKFNYNIKKSINELLIDFNI